MTPELAERMRALASALEAIEFMAYDTEGAALPGPAKEGLLRARMRFAQIRAWLRTQSEAA